MTNPGYEAIRTRRVTRRMTDQPISQRDLDLVEQSARYSPNAGNRRLQPLVRVTDPVLIRLLRMVSPGMLPVPQAILVICVDRARATGYGFRPDTPGLYVDVGTTAATVLIAAQTIGLGACPVTSFSAAAARRLLDLDTQVTPHMLICLGHPDHEQPPPMLHAESPNSPSRVANRTGSRI